MSLNRGVRMNGYKRVRRELGTIAYEIERKPNVYEKFYEKEAEAVREFIKLTQPSTRKPNEDQPKKVEIKEKKNKMDDIMMLIDSPEDTPIDSKEEDKSKADKPKEEDKPKAEQPKQVGGSHMKTIRVTNIQADAKKNALIL